MAEELTDEEKYKLRSIFGLHLQLTENLLLSKKVQYKDRLEIELREDKALIEKVLNLLKSRLTFGYGIPAGCKGCKQFDWIITGERWNCNLAFERGAWCCLWDTFPQIFENKGGAVE